MLSSIKPLIEMCTGTEMITNEDLTAAERSLKGIMAIVDIFTLGKSAIVSKIGSKFFSKLGTREAIGEILENSSEKDILSIIDKEVSTRKIVDGGYKTLDDLRYEQYWEDLAKGKYDIPYGMNAEEYSKYLRGLKNVNDDIAIRKVDYDEILKLRNKGISKAEI